MTSRTLWGVGMSREETVYSRSILVEPSFQELRSFLTDAADGDARGHWVDTCCCGLICRRGVKERITGRGMIKLACRPGITGYE